MNATEVIFVAREAGLRLSVTEKDTIFCQPRHRLTPKLREAIRANREQLLYDVLMGDALRYLNAHYVEGADLSALSVHEDAINDAYLRDWTAYRRAVQAYVQAGLREIQRAKGAGGAS